MSNEYVTIIELRASPYNVDVGLCDDVHLGILQDITKKIIDNMCGQEFGEVGSVASPTEHKVSGLGKDTIFLPRRLTALVDIRIYSSSTEYTTYLPANFTVKKKFITWDVYSDSYVEARLRVEDFPLGKYNVGVRGIWGWTAVPDPIKYLQAKMIMKMIQNESFADKFKSEKVGDYAYTLADTNDSILGDVELDEIIKQYREWISYAVQ